jgi:hypothetical protein
MATVAILWIIAVQALAILVPALGLPLVLWMVPADPMQAARHATIQSSAHAAVSTAIVEMVLHFVVLEAGTFSLPLWLGDTN